MDDRLEEIRAKYDYSDPSSMRLGMPEDVKWLIEEVERLRKLSIKAHFVMMEEMDAGISSLIIRDKAGEATRAVVFLMGEWTQEILDVIDKATADD